MKFNSVFIDRDGTIGELVNVDNPRSFELYPFSSESFRILKKANLKLFAFTNQSGISKGFITEEECKEQLKSFGFDDEYICPHRSSVNCNCRKPKIGLLLKACEDYDLDLKKSVLIGDSIFDMIAANRGNLTKVLVKTGQGLETLKKIKEKNNDIKIDYLAENFLDAAKWIISNN